MSIDKEKLLDILGFLGIALFSSCIMLMMIIVNIFLIKLILSMV